MSYWDKKGTRKTLNSQRADSPNSANPTNLQMTSSQTATAMNEQSTSTPATSPTPSQRQRQAEGATLNDLEVSNVQFDAFNTPFGQGVNHQLQLNQPPFPDLMEMADEQFSKLVQDEADNIKSFKQNFTNDEDWPNKLDAEASRLTDRIDRLITAAVSNTKRAQRAQLYNHRKELREIIDNFRKMARNQSEQRRLLNISPSVLAPGTTQRRTEVLNGIQRLPVDEPALEQDNEEEQNNRTNPANLTNTQNRTVASYTDISATITDILQRLSALEKDQHTKHNLLKSKTNELVASLNNKVSRTDLDSALQRICQLELSDQNRQSKLDEDVKKLQESLKVVELLVDGQAEDYQNLKRRLTALEDLSDVVPLGQSFQRRSRPAPRENNDTSLNIPTGTANTQPRSNIRITVDPPSTSHNPSAENANVPPEAPQSSSNSAAPAASLGSSRIATEAGGDGNISSESIILDGTYADFVKQRLKEAGRSLTGLLQPEIDNSLSKNKIASLHKSTLQLVCSERRDLEKLIDKYEKYPRNQLDTAALMQAGNILSEARDWCSNLISRYDELDCANRPVDSKLFDSLGIFTETSETSVYEFLRKFDTFMEDMGSKADRAALLYEQHLDDNIKLLTVDLRADLDKLKEWLIKRFGEPKNMCENILKQLNKGNPPADTNVTSALLLHYRNLNAAIKRIEELHSLPGIPVEKLTSHIEGADFLNNLVRLLPSSAHKDFFEQLYKEDIDTTNLQGQRVWSVLTRIVMRHSKMIEGRALASGVSSTTKQKQPDKPEKDQSKKSKSANASSLDPAVHHSDQQSSKKDDEKDSNKQGKKKAKEDSSSKKSANNFDFPCPCPGHKHELGECKSFFAAKSRKRLILAEGNSCFTCLKPFKSCKSGCKNKVPEILLCKGCEPEANRINKTPLNVILCPKSDHKENLDEEEVQKELKKYLTKFDPAILAKGKTVVNHVLLSVHASTLCQSCPKGKCTCHPQTMTRKPEPNQPTPRIDTSTGERQSVDDSKIIEESDHDAFYVMQILNLGGQDVLTFYDRGANHNMIKGELAEDIDLKVITDQPMNIGVVGGGKVWTSYGTYSLSLGPNPDGFYHDLSAQGITKITEKFPRYQLDEVNSELRSYSKFKSEKLPKYIGGQETGLLIGVKDTGLEPTLIFQLPSGLGVFKSPLKDKFGSNICYGGPHRIFSEANEKAGGFHVSVHFTQMINQYRNSLYPSLSKVIEPEFDELGNGVLMPRDSPPCISLPLSKTQPLYASAVDEDDLQEMGIPIDKLDETDEDCACSSVESSIVPMDDQHANLAVHKAKVPLARQKEYFDNDDVEQTHALRCEDCAKCKKCGQSARSRMISLQEKIEQEAIEASVKIDLVENKAWVDLPFLKDPITHLKSKHNGEDSNFNQAIKVYKQQCKKPEHMRKEFNKVHADLVNKGFMKKIDDLPEEYQNIIQESAFKHVMPWRIAEKPDSLSTPFRMVVDGTMTGLNQLLAKGENRMSKIPDIMLRNRCRRKIWSSDVSKLYNQLHLLPSAMPFCLFLFKEDLNINDEPDVYVMTRAWYGIAPVGNQALEALNQLTSILEPTHPKARSIITSDLYVDDVLTGADTDAEVEKQIEELTDALGKGGFSLKYVVKSGEKPCSEASVDGESLKILGYKWKPEEDYMYPGFGEINFNKKRRGAKKPNDFPVVTPDDVTKVLQNVKISRRTVVSKMAELWDPIGLWEPYKLQLKLDSTYLKGMDWDVELPEDLQELWTKRFREMTQIPEFSAMRCVVPPDAIDPSKLRLLCLADAAEDAGGCCIYAGFLKSDGTYSCSLLLARSKLLNQKVPRNELEAVKIMAETAVSVRSALKDLVDEVIYVTDSTIALCWCNNIQKKLKVYTLFRVTEIRRNILGEVFPADNVRMPLFHIDGHLNPADLVTKRHEITPEKIGPGSIWQNGEPWMSLPTNEMPLTTYEDLKLSKADETEIKTECFPEVIMSKTINAVLPVQDGQVYLGQHHCHGCNQHKVITPMDVCYGTTENFDHCINCDCNVTFSSFSLKRGGDSQMLIDLIKFGWKKATAILSNVIKFATKLKHKVHLSKGVSTTDCLLCSSESRVPLDFDEDKLFAEEGLKYIFRKETCRIMPLMTKKKLDQYILMDGILYYQSRLNSEFKSEDLDCQAFFDSHDIKEYLPVVFSDSDIFFSYVIHIHYYIRPHSGVEITMKEASKIMMVVNNPRKIVQSIRKNCPTCRAIQKKTVELRMLNHPSARTTLAPPFYIAQMDTVFGFRAQVFKDARKTVKIYALIICCLLTGATNILVIEGLETRDVLQAIERHAFRHGMPTSLYVDNGTNLVALQHATFSLRDLSCQLSDSHGIEVKVSNAKSHEERGRVEARVKILRSMLDKLQIKTDTVLSVLQWENLFSKISNMINDLPIAKCTESTITDIGWDIITPNRLLLGRNNTRSLQGQISLSKSLGSENLLRKNRSIMENWYQIFVNRIHHLIPRPNKWIRTDKVQIGDICLFMYNEAPGVGKDQWKLGRITDMPKPNKVIISFPTALHKKGLPKLKTITRCPRDISIIHASDQIDLNTREYLENLLKEK